MKGRSRLLFAMGAGGAVAGALGWLPREALGVSALWSAWALWDARGAPPPPPGALVRGRDPGACAWLVAVASGDEGAALAMATAVAADRARITFFVEADAGKLARELAVTGHAVGWLGAPRLAGQAPVVLPNGTVIVGVANPRVPLYWPRSKSTTDLVRACGLRYVVATVTLPERPDGERPVGTDLVAVPVTLSGLRLEDWLADLDRRAIRVVCPA